MGNFLPVIKRISHKTGFCDEMNTASNEMVSKNAFALSRISHRQGYNQQI